MKLFVGGGQKPLDVDLSPIVFPFLLLSTVGSLGSLGSGDRR